MKVLLIDVNCKNSSTGKIVYDLYTAINETGNEAAVCYGRGENIHEKNIFKFGIDIETYIHALLTRITGFTGCFSPFSTFRLIRFVKKFKPDVVHIHELHAYFVNIKPLINYLKKNKIQTVMTLHCEFAYTGKCGHSVECEKWQTECGDCPHLKDYPSTLFFDHTKFMFNQKKKLFEDFDNLTIVTPSKWLAERAKQSFLKNKDVRVIHNGIDTDVFSPKNTSALRTMHNITDDEKIVLAVAPNLMSGNKGGKYVLELADRMKEQNVRFVLIGVDEEMTSENNNVILLHRIYDKELLAQYYSLADVFVICSERENFPTTCIESQCCGTPVCGFDVGGVKETILNDYALCDYGDIDGLMHNVAKILESHNSSGKTSIAGKAAFYFGKNNMFRQTFDLYTSNNQFGECR